MEAGGTFASAERTFFTSESVTEGHPDKVCDQISDAVLDAVLRDDPDAHVACETATTTGMILVFGEISTSTYVDIPAVVRDVVRDIGYTHSKFGFDAKTCGVMVAIKEQSVEISSGVEQALEVRTGHKVDRFD
ncbi:MAG: methionine adenosyltransferase, partial [Chloroflexota bacterium]|nr:methionine adenosyltransferase [Chloroflexota bacterium]